MFPASKNNEESQHKVSHRDIRNNGDIKKTGIKSQANTLQVSLKLLLPLLAAILAMSPLAVDMYLPAMPTIAEHLNTPITMVQNSLSVYLIGFSLGLVLFGPMADKYPRRKLVLLGMSGFFIASLSLAFVCNIEQFLTIRFLQAFISSAATVVVPGAVREYYGKDTAKGLSYVTMIMMLAPMIAPSIGSVLLLAHSWQLIFYVLAAYSFIVILLVIAYLPNAVVNASTIETNKKPALTFIQRYKVVLGNGEARLDIVSSMMISLAFFAYLTAISYIYLSVYSVSEFTFSLLFSLNAVGLMSAHFINTRLVVRKGSRAMLRFALVIAIMAVLALVAVSILELSLPYVVMVIFLLMGSISMISVNSDALVLTRFPTHSGTVTAVLGTLRWGVGALAGPILTFFYDGTAKPFAFLMMLAVFTVLSCQLLVKFNDKSGKHKRRSQSALNRE